MGEDPAHPLELQPAHDSFSELGVRIRQQQRAVQQPPLWRLVDGMDLYPPAQVAGANVGQGSYTTGQDVREGRGGM